MDIGVSLSTYLPVGKQTLGLSVIHCQGLKSRKVSNPFFLNTGLSLSTEQQGIACASLGLPRLPSPLRAVDLVWPWPCGARPRLVRAAVMNASRTENLVGNVNANMSLYGNERETPSIR